MQLAIETGTIAEAQSLLAKSWQVIWENQHPAGDEFLTVGECQQIHQNTYLGYLTTLIDCIDPTSGQLDIENIKERLKKSQKTKFNEENFMRVANDVTSNAKKLIAIFADAEPNN